MRLSVYLYVFSTDMEAAFNRIVPETWNKYVAPLVHLLPTYGN